MSRAEIIERLKAYEYGGVYLNFQGEKILAKCIDVVDSETIVICTLYRDRFTLFRVKLYGYKAYDSNSANLLDRKKALFAHTYLTQNVAGQVIQLSGVGVDHSGKLVMNAWRLDEKTKEPKKTTIAEDMIEAGVAQARGGHMERYY
jgi:hypothetical protein